MCVIALVSLAILGMTTAACGRGSDVQADEPAGRDGGLVAGGFEALPKPDGSEPLTDPTIEGTTTTQSFRVLGSFVEEILGFYKLELPKEGWKLLGLPTEVGDGDWQGRWVRADQTLEVSVSPEDVDDTTTSQLDLVLTG